MTNREELKAKIIKELLPSLSVDPYNSYVKADELSQKTYESVEDYYFGDHLKSVSIDPEHILTTEDLKEIS